MNEINYDDILHVLTGNAGDELKKAVLERVAADPEWKREYIRIKNSLSVASTRHPMPDADLQAMYDAFRPAAPTRRNRLILPGRWMAYAAVFVVLLIAGLLARQYLTGDASVTRSEVVTARGQQSRVVLPDKSEVLLNFDSKLSYDSRYGSRNREVIMEGQAFFDIAKNRKLPFRIKTGMVELAVLGTSFDVNAYPDYDRVQVSVYTGAVEMKVSGHKQLTLTLKAGEIIMSGSLTAACPVEAGDSIQAAFDRLGTVGARFVK